MHAVYVESLEAHSEPLVGAVQSLESFNTEKVSDDAGSLRAIVLTPSQLMLSESQKAKIAKAQEQISIGIYAACIFGVALGALLFLVPGSKGANRYGHDPRGAA